MSTERLGTPAVGPSPAARRLAADRGTPHLDANLPTGTDLVLDLDDDTARPAGHRRPNPVPWRKLARRLPAAAVVVAALVAGLPQPRAVPSAGDFTVTLSADPRGVPSTTDALGAVRLLAVLRHDGSHPVELTSVRVLDVGVPAPATSFYPVVLGPGGQAELPVTVLPSCERLRDRRSGAVGVQLAARGPGGARDVRVVARESGNPLDAVCPERGRGIHVVLTGYRKTRGGTGVDLRLVNAGTVPVLVGEPGSPPRDLLASKPDLPVFLTPGEAQVVRTYFRAACPPQRASAVPRLEARAAFGWQPVVDGAGAVVGVESVVAERC